MLIIKNSSMRDEKEIKWNQYCSSLRSFYNPEGLISNFIVHLFPGNKQGYICTLYCSLILKWWTKRIRIFKNQFYIYWIICILFWCIYCFSLLDERWLVYRFLLFRYNFSYFVIVRKDIIYIWELFYSLLFYSIYLFHDVSNDMSFTVRLLRIK